MEPDAPPTWIERLTSPLAKALYLAAFVSFVTWLVLRPSAVEIAHSEALLTELREARALGVAVVNARSLVGPGGTLRPGARPERWELLSPRLEERCLPPLPPERRTAFVFLHGFDNSLVDGIRSGNHLARTFAAAGGTSPWSFTTFCWRGDFGREAYGTSEQAAESTGPALADFLVRLRAGLDSVHGGRERCALIVITHSLGAKLALEALKGRPGEPLVDGLLLVQAAVPVGEVAEGEYTWVMSIPAKAGGGHTEPQKGTTSARYVPSFKAARSVVAVQSAGDGVLLSLFGAYQKPSSRAIFTPSIHVALGTITPDLRDSNAKGHLKYPPNLERIDLSPGVRTPEIDRHSQLSQEEGLPRYLFERVLKPWMR